jgi:hypothetical protein
VGAAPTAYFNTYNPASGWGTAAAIRSTSITYLAMTYADTVFNTLASIWTMGGVDISLDDSGNGWAVTEYRSANDAANTILVLERYEQGSGFTGSYRIVDTFSAAAIGEGFTMPRVWTRSDGGGSVFYLKLDAGYYALYRADFSSSGFLTVAPTRIDTDDLTSGVIADEDIAGGDFIDPIGVGQARTNYMPFQFVNAGDQGAIAFVKQLAGVNRLYFSRYSSGSWTTPVTIDDTTYGVGWASLAIKGDGGSGSDVQFMMAYEGLDATLLASSTVYARSYNSARSAYTAQQRIGTGLTTTNARPTAFVTRDGKAGVVFSALSGGLRRVYVSTYQ